MKIYAGLHGDMQKPRIKSRGDNISENMSKLVSIPSVKPAVDGTAVLNISKAIANADVAASVTERIGDHIALLRSNP